MHTHIHIYTYHDNYRSGPPEIFQSRRLCSGIQLVTQSIKRQNFVVLIRLLNAKNVKGLVLILGEKVI